MDYSNLDDNLTSIFVKILEHLDLESEKNYIYYVPETEWMSIYLDKIEPINLGDYVLLYNHESYVWIKVILEEKYIIQNETLPLGSKLFLGKICNIIKNKPYNYGTLTYFTISQIHEQKTFSELVKKYSK